MSWKERRAQKKGERQAKREEKAAKQREEWAAKGILFKVHGYGGEKLLRREITLFEDRVEVERYASMMMQPEKTVLPYEAISSVTVSPGLVHGTVVFQAGGRSVEADGIGNGVLDEIRDRVLSAVNDRRNIAPAPSSSADRDVLAQIEKLGELREAGVLTEEEFMSKKAELLSRL